MIGVIFSVIAPVLVCTGVGLVWAKRGVVYEAQFITRLVTNVGFPCLIFSTLVRTEIDWSIFSAMGLAALGTTAAFGVIAAPALRLARLELRVFLPAMMFANTGNMGLPLCLLAFGEEGLALAISYFTISALLIFVFGPAIASGKASIIEALKTPLLWSALIALLVMYAELPVPAWIMKTLEILGGFAIPLMLITLGFSLAELRLTSLPRGFGLSALRLIMGFGVGWGTAALFGLEGAMRGIIIIESTMPVAALNYLYAQMYDARPADVAGVIVVSTVISFATLPALLWFVL